MAARTFEIQARLRAADGKWPLVPGTLHVSASTLDELCAELHSALAAHAGSAVHVVGVKDEDEDKWVAVTSMAGTPDSAKLKLEIGTALSSNSRLHQHRLCHTTSPTAVATSSLARPEPSLRSLRSPAMQTVSLSPSRPAVCHSSSNTTARSKKG